MPTDPPFYIGWQDQAPAPLGAFARRVAMGLVALALAVGAALTLTQGPFAASSFAFGHPERWEGVVGTWPAPALWTTEGGALHATLLVAPGKFGADDLLAGLDGHRVQVEGTRIARDGTVMVELAPETLQDQGLPAEPLQGELPLGEVTLQGEIVDSKCFLGVMNPGDGKVHRDCAVRCISGGVPPALWVRASDGTMRTVILVGPEGEPIGQALLPLVAEPVTARGQLQRRGDLYVLRLAPSDVKRVDGRDAGGR